MFTEFTDYKVELYDRVFTTSGGIHRPKTVLITVTDPDQEKSYEQEYGFISAEEIYKMLDEGLPLLLNECYIERFSLTEYRISREKDSKERIPVTGFSTRKAFFNCPSKIDLSFADFGDGDIDLESCVFARGIVTFNSSHFGNGHVNFAYSLFRNGNVDFANTIFGRGDISFKNCKFHTGTKDFQYANFGTGNVSFVNAEFGNGDVSFINTLFHEGDISFKVARFGEGKVDFHYAKFGTGDISFERTEFGEGKVDFRMAEFRQSKVNFNRAVFGNGDITFEGSELSAGKFMFKRAELGYGSVNFEQAEFGNAELYFDGTNFGKGTISFNNGKFHVLSLHSCQLDDYVDIRCREAGLVDLSDTVVRDIIDMMPYEFAVNISTLNMAGMRLIGRIYIDWKKNHVEQIIGSQTDTSERMLAEQFRTLKQNFNETGLYSDEDTAYVRFKRYESLADLHESIAPKPISALWKYPEYWFKWLVLDKIGLYATSPIRVLFSVLIIWFVFGIFFFLSELSGIGCTHSSVNNPDQLSALSQSFYHSAITFFTIGYGDVFPEGFSRILSAIEGFTGVFMMSYFTVAFVRKILR